MNVTYLAAQLGEQFQGPTRQGFLRGRLSSTQSGTSVSVGGVKQNAKIPVPYVVHDAHDLRRLVKGEPGLKLIDHTHATIRALRSRGAEGLHQTIPADLRLNGLALEHVGRTYAIHTDTIDSEIVGEHEVL